MTDIWDTPIRCIVNRAAITNDYGRTIGETITINLDALTEQLANIGVTLTDAQYQAMTEWAAHTSYSYTEPVGGYTPL